MSRFLRILLPVFLLAGGASRASVLMLYWNTHPFLDADGVTPLQGTSSSGDLIQLISAGINGVVDPPGLYGAPGGDDAFLTIVSGYNSRHIGANEPPVNHNLGYFNAVASYDEVQVSLPVFVRFWNGNQPWTATHFGVTDVFNLPAADPFGLGYLDVAPAPESPRITDTAFTSGIPVAVPEPNGLIFLGIAALLLRQQLVSRK